MAPQSQGEAIKRFGPGRRRGCLGLPWSCFRALKKHHVGSEDGLVFNRLVRRQNHLGSPMPQNHDFQHVVRPAQKQSDEDPLDDCSVEARVEFA